MRWENEVFLLATVECIVLEDVDVGARYSITQLSSYMFISNSQKTARSATGVVYLLTECRIHSMHHRPDHFTWGEELPAVKFFSPIFSSKSSYTCERVKK
jgi:hypothetical protein